MIFSFSDLQGEGGGSEVLMLMPLQTSLIETCIIYTWFQEEKPSKLDASSAARSASRSTLKKKMSDDEKPHSCALNFMHITQSVGHI